MLKTRDSISAALLTATKRLADAGELNLAFPPEIAEVERPRIQEHGDWSSNLALTLAKQAKRSPREIAELIAGAIEVPGGIREVAVEGAGFVNFHLDPEAWGEVVREVVESGSDFGSCSIGAGTVTNLEFVSANPTGPMHLGHARWAAWGDALGRLLSKSGFTLTREFYINDAGNQLELLGKSLAARYLHALGQEAEVPEDGYQGDYLVDLAAELVAEVGDSWAAIDAGERDEKCGEWGCARLTREIKDQLGRLGVEFDVWFSERAMRESGAVERALDDLRELDKVYEAEGATWLRSTDFGDDKDRVLVKSDGSYTYLAGDIAYHRDKFARGFELLIDLWGADHGGHVPKLRAAIEALGYPVDSLEVVLGQLVSLERGGEPVRMSKRSGDVYTYEELVDEIGPDAARFHFLMQGPDSALRLDLDAIVAQSMENPVFYVQMAHARICSIQRKAAEAGIDREAIDEVDLGLLVANEELSLLRKLDEYPDLIADAAQRRAPHRLTQWARELAGAFHSFYQEHRVIDGPGQMVQARLWLIEACRIGLADAMGLLGVHAPELMERIDADDSIEGES
ncbi:MAG: arginine--tRNA ligase [Acidobacteria bacterium]|nr:MAG: arginine--tRNA ligase [Acidobacteriota bacterium]